MKKFLTVALVAAMACAAQAVTINWSVNIPAACQPKPGSSPTGEWIAGALVAGKVTAENFATYDTNTKNLQNNTTFPQGADSARPGGGGTSGPVTMAKVLKLRLP